MATVGRVHYFCSLGGGYLMRTPPPLKMAGDVWCACLDGLRAF